MKLSNIEVADLRLFEKTDQYLSNEIGSEALEVFHYFSPGRVNLIGEHIDYCGGRVLPAAIDLGCFFSVKVNTSNQIKVFSSKANELRIINLNKKIVPTGSNDWFEYVKGVVSWMSEDLQLSGLDIAIESNIPGGGLSSSAALEVGLAFIFIDQFGQQDDLECINLRKSLALGSVKVENSFVGVNCGVMDQASVALGRQNQAMLLDCASLNVDYIPADFHEFELVVMDTNKPRKLIESKYNERREETESALKRIKRVLPISTLCELDEQQYRIVDSLFPQGPIKSRLKHVVGERLRVDCASEALKQGDIAKFGNLMIESHLSLDENFAVTGKELNSIVNAALEQEGVVGARMTGAGFGGCAIALVHHKNLEQFLKNVPIAYKEIIGYLPHLTPVKIGPGTRRIAA